MLCGSWGGGNGEMNGRKKVGNREMREIWWGGLGGDIVRFLCYEFYFFGGCFILNRYSDVGVFCDGIKYLK